MGRWTDSSTSERDAQRGWTNDPPQRRRPTGGRHRHYVALAHRPATDRPRWAYVGEGPRSTPTGPVQRGWTNDPRQRRRSTGGRYCYHATVTHGPVTDCSRRTHVGGETRPTTRVVTTSTTGSTDTDRASDFRPLDTTAPDAGAAPSQTPRIAERVVGSRCATSRDRTAAAAGSDWQHPIPRGSSPRS